MPPIKIKITSVEGQVQLVDLSAVGGQVTQVKAQPHSRIEQVQTGEPKRPVLKKSGTHCGEFGQCPCNTLTRYQHGHARKSGRLEHCR